MLERQQHICWPYFERLRRNLTVGNFWPESITLPGAFTVQASVVWDPREGNHTATPLAPPTDPPLGEKRKSQRLTHNPWAAAHLQVDPTFRIHRAIYAAAEEGFSILDTDDGRQLCLSYHFKGVCNSNCGGWHSHRTMM